MRLTKVKQSRRYAKPIIDSFLVLVTFVLFLRMGKQLLQNGIPLFTYQLVKVCEMLMQVLSEGLNTVHLYALIQYKKYRTLHNLHVEYDRLT